MKIYRQNSTLGRAVLLASCWMALPSGASWAPMAARNPEAVSSVSCICWQTALCSDFSAPSAFLVRSITSWKSWSTWLACERVSRMISCITAMDVTRNCKERWTCSDASCTFLSVKLCHSVGVVCLFCEWKPYNFITKITSKRETIRTCWLCLWLRNCDHFRLNPHQECSKGSARLRLFDLSGQDPTAICLPNTIKSSFFCMLVYKDIPWRTAVAHNRVSQSGGCWINLAGFGFVG